MRTLFALLFAIILITPASAQLCGDMDGNSAVTVTDGVIVLRMAAELPVSVPCAQPTSHPTPRATATPVPKATATPVPIPTAVDPLTDLLGTWNFTFTIISTFTDTYRLQRIETVNGVRTIVGLDQFSEVIIANRVQELTPGSNIPEEFALLDTSASVCELHVFNHARGSDTVSGRTLVTFSDGAGGCDSSVGQIYAMSGVRTSHSASASTFDQAETFVASASTARSAHLMEESTSVSSGVAVDPMWQGLLERMLDQ